MKVLSIWNIFGCMSVRQFSATNVRMNYGRKGCPLPSEWSQRPSLKGTQVHGNVQTSVKMKGEEKGESE